MRSGGEQEKSKIVGGELLSALIRANMADDLAPAHWMSDEEFLAQITAFMAAAHETSAVSVLWTLLSLAQNQEVQDKLRAELSLVSEEAPSMDDLNALPYLDIVVKEVLRFHSPVHQAIRTVVQDDDIPLSRPVVDKHGMILNSIHVQSGELFAVEILAIN